MAFCLTTARPKQTVRIWSYLLCHIRFDSGEVDLTRQEIADALGASAEHVSTALGELARFGAIYKARGRWHINPDVAWCGRQEARRKRAKEAPALKLG